MVLLGNPFDTMKRFVSTANVPTYKPPDIFPPEGICSEGLDAFRFFLNSQCVVRTLRPLQIFCSVRNNSQVVLRARLVILCRKYCLGLKPLQCNTYMISLLDDYCTCTVPSPTLFEFPLCCLPSIYINKDEPCLYTNSVCVFIFSF